MMLWKSSSMTIPITDGSGNVHAVASMAIFAFMFWPQSARDAFMLTDAWQSDLALTADGSMSDFVSGRLKASTDRSSAGGLAGQTLLHFLSLAEHYPKNASLNKAWHLVWVSLMRDKPAASKVPTSISWLKKCWADFRPSAHLWAAFIGHGDLVVADPAQFMAIAEALRRRAVKGGLKLDDCWGVPADLQLAPVVLEIPALTSEGETALAAYRAPKTAK